MNIRSLLENKYEIMLLFLLIYSFTIRTINLSEYDFGSAWDEGYYAMATRNIVYDPSNVIYPRYLPNSDVLIDKPPGLFLIGAIFIGIFGIGEINYRLVSIIFGTLSVYVFYLIARSLFDRKTALISSIVFASFPLHVAFSRIFQMDVPVLFYALLVSYFFVIGVCNKNNKLLLISIPLIAINILTKLWTGILPLLGVYFWLYLKQRKERYLKAYFIKSIIAFVIGFLIFLIWPTILWLTPEEYTGFHGGCSLKNSCNVWKMLIEYNFLNRLDISLDKTLTLYLGYLPLGHFHPSQIFNVITLIFFIMGFFFVIYYLMNRKSLHIDGYLFGLFWLISFLPIYLGHERYVQRLVILTPFFSIVIGIGIVKLYDLIKSVPLRTVILAIVMFLLLKSPIDMILGGNEVLYRTYYREMGDFIKTRIDNYNYSIICRYYPGMTYYSGKRCIRTDSLSKPISEYIKNKEVRFVELKMIGIDNILRPSDVQWVVKNCKNVDKYVGIPDTSVHKLYDCSPEE